MPALTMFAPGHGITDLATVPNAFSGGSWTYTVTPNATLDGVIINEFNAANENGLQDEDGEETGGPPILLALMIARPAPPVLRRPRAACVHSGNPPKPPYLTCGLK